MPIGEPSFEQKLKPDASYEELEARIPEVAAMKGFDQRSDFHTLTLDEHTKELVRNLESNITSVEDYYESLGEKGAAELAKVKALRPLIILAGNLHDLGKTSEAGQQVHPKDPEKLQFIGHEEESERLVQEVLPKYFDLTPEQLGIVAKLAGLHALALNLIAGFRQNIIKDNQPVEGAQMKGKALKAFDNFIAKVEEIPGDLSLEAKMRLVLAFNKSDKSGGWNNQSNLNDTKVQTVIKKAEDQIAVLEQMEEALPALLAALEGRRAGDEAAGITYENGKYIYKKPEKKEKAAVDPELMKKLKPHSRILKDKTTIVAENWALIQGKAGNEKALVGILKGKLGLNEEQIAVVIDLLKE